MQGRSLDELIALLERDETTIEEAARELEGQEPAVELVIEEGHGKDSQDIRTQLLTMKLSDKVKLAMFGNSTCRGLLIFDANKMIQQFVLKNPRLMLNEIEDFSKSPNLSESVIRSIADRKEWMKHYPLKANLVRNPKTPPDIALKLLKFLTVSDLRIVARSKNIPQVIAVGAKKILADHTPK